VEVSRLREESINRKNGHGKKVQIKEGTRRETVCYSGGSDLTDVPRATHTRGVKQQATEVPMLK